MASRDLNRRHPGVNVFRIQADMITGTIRTLGNGIQVRTLFGADLWPLARPDHDTSWMRARCLVTKAPPRGGNCGSGSATHFWYLRQFGFQNLGMSQVLKLNVQFWYLYFTAARNKNNEFLPMAIAFNNMRPKTIEYFQYMIHLKNDQWEIESIPKKNLVIHYNKSAVYCKWEIARQQQTTA